MRTNLGDYAERYRLRMTRVLKGVLKFAHVARVISRGHSHHLGGDPTRHLPTRPHIRQTYSTEVKLHRTRAVSWVGWKSAERVLSRSRECLVEFGNLVSHAICRHSLQYTCCWLHHTNARKLFISPVYLTIT